MEQRPIFRDRFDVTLEDMEAILDGAQTSDDHIVADAIERGRRYVGFDVTQEASTVVNVAPGRLYFDGRRHFRDEAGGVPLDLISVKPALQRRIVAIVGWPQEFDTDIDFRDQEIDAQTQQKSPQEVPTRRVRTVVLEAKAGVESVSPQPPVLEATFVVLAYVTMGPAGIEQIVQNGAAQLRNLSDVDQRLVLAEDWIETAAPKVESLQTDVAKLAATAATIADRKLLYDLAGQTALISQRVGLPASYIGLNGTNFEDDGRAASDPAYAGYAARVAEGLRFPFAAEDEQALSLKNPFNPNAALSPAGLLLPRYTRFEWRVTRGDAGTLGLTQYAYANHSILKLEMSRTRIRYGGDFEVSTNSAFWMAGSYEDRVNGGVRSTFIKDGETFQVYETGKIDADGHKIVRLAKYWVDTVDSPYWTRTASAQPTPGHANVQTFLNAQDRWVVDLGPHIKRKPQNGSITIGICETTNGEPDMGRVLSMVTVDAAQVGIVGGAGAFPVYAIEPTFLKGGVRYGLFIITQQDFGIGVSDGLGQSTGTHFYGLDGGKWFANPGTHLIWRVGYARFDQPRQDIELTELQLAGGIQLIDILAESIAPASTEVVYAVQVAGVWRPLSELDPDVLAAGGALLPLRVSLIGTADIAPAIRLQGSRAQVGRLATASKWAPAARALAAPANTVTLKAVLNGFNPAHHTFTPTIDRGGTIETPDVTTTVTRPDGSVESTAVFNLAAAASAYRPVIQQGTDHFSRPYVVASMSDVAT